MTLRGRGRAPSGFPWPCRIRRSKVSSVTTRRPLELILARNLMSALSTPAFLVDEGGVLVFYNEAAGALLGKRFEELGTVGPEEWGSLFGPFDEQRRADPLRRAAAGRRGAQRPPRARQLRDPVRRRRPPRDRGLRLPDPHRARLAGRDRGLLALRRSNGDRRPAEMKVKLWGTRGSIPSPGPETIRYGGNTSCVGVTLSDGSLLALDAGTGIRNLGLSLRRGADPAPHPPHPPAPRPHPGPRLLRPRLPPPDRDRDLGPVLARGLAARPDRPLHLGAALPGRGARAALRRLLPPLPGDRVGDRPGADPRRLGHPPRADPRLPDRRRRHLARLHPRPRARARRRPRHPRRGLDLGLRAGPRRLAADPRRPVLRRRVPRPRRLGPLRPLPRALLRQAQRRRAHAPLPPRPAAQRRAPRPARRRSRASAGRRSAAARARSSSPSRAPSTSSRARRARPRRAAATA